MKQKKFFNKLVENLDKLEPAEIRHFLSKLEKERVTFSQVLNDLDLGLMVIEGDSLIYCNTRARDMILLPDIDLPCPLPTVYKQAKNPSLLQSLTGLHSEIPAGPVVLLTDRHNRSFEASRIDTDLGYSILKFKDVTSQRDLEFKLKQFESIGALNTMAAGIAHEIKNPLAAIDLHTQILRKGIKNNLIFVPEEVESYIQIVEEETRRLNNILNDFLLSARKRELKLSFVDFNEYIGDILHFMNPVVEEQQVILDTEWGDIPKLFLDREYLRQAIINLLKNALEAMHHSDVRRIRVTTFYDLGRDSVGLSLCDTGQGMSEETMKKVFEPYFSTKSSGTGLGLTIVYKIIKEHGGDILVESKSGQGTTFVIFLPIRQGQRLLQGDKI